MIVDRYTAPIVDDGNAVIDVDLDLDAVAMTSECFVDGIIDNLINEMM
jgi:hypothetical protein